MLKNYIITTFRVLWRKKGYSLINILGLSLGIAGCILILTYVNYQLNFDAFHEDADRIYRVQLDKYQEGELVFNSAVNFAAAGPALEADFPEIEKATRLFPREGVVAYEDRKFREPDIFQAEHSLFDIFSFKLLEGDRNSVLSNPNEALISESTSNKYFADESPIGKTIKFGAAETYQIIGVFEDVPAHSHLHFDFLFSYSTLTKEWGDGVEISWNWFDFYTYIKTVAGTDADALEAQFPEFVDKYKADSESNTGMIHKFFLQPLTDIHLHSNLGWEAEPNGNARSVYFLLIIALFILVIAWINYINLATARATERAREVGIRKVTGATRGRLIRQFLIESMMLNLIAGIIAFGMVELAQGYFEQISGEVISISLWDSYTNWLVLLGVFLFGTILAGAYPAFVLSAFQPALVLKGTHLGVGKGGLLRKGLVTFQFAISSVLMIGTIIVYQQVDFMRNQDLGIDINQTLVLKGPGVVEHVEGENIFGNKMKVFRDQIENLAGVSSTTTSNNVPGVENFAYGSLAINNKGKQVAVNSFRMRIDEEFIPTYDLELMAGRNFSKDFGEDQDHHSVMINEKLLYSLGFDSAEEAVGKIFNQGTDYESKIIGVLKDFHQMSLKKAVDPIIFYYQQENRSFCSLKIQTGEFSQTMTEINRIWEEVFPGNPLDYFFLDQFFDAQYRADQRFGKIFTLFAILGIIVASLGLLGLTAYSALRRSREIGIRKVLGASISHIIVLITTDFFKLVLLANAISWVAAWLLMNQWLETFAVRIDVSPWVFVIVTFASVLVAMLTMIIHAIRAASSNPADVLKID